MARTGRPPVPRELKLVRGNPGKRPIPETLMLPPSCPPEPNWKRLRIDADRGAEVWREVIPPLDEAGQLARVDRRMIYDYIRCIVRLDECEAEVELAGKTVETSRRGQAERSVKSNPLLQWMAHYRSTIHKYEVELGVGAGNRATRQVPADAEPQRSVWTG